MTARSADLKSLTQLVRGHYGLTLASAASGCWLRSVPLLPIYSFVICELGLIPSASLSFSSGKYNHCSSFAAMRQGFNKTRHVTTTTSTKGIEPTNSTETNEDTVMMCWGQRAQVSSIQVLAGPDLALFPRSDEIGYIQGGKAEVLAFSIKWWRSRREHGRNR